MAYSNSDDLIKLLPHRGVMRLIDSVVSVDETTVETRTVINEKRAHLFGNEGNIEAYLGVELIAQSAALPILFNSPEQAHRGVITQVQSFQAYGNVAAKNPVLSTRCTVELLLDGLIASVTGTVLHEQNVVCESVITLSIQGAEG